VRFTIDRMPLLYDRNPHCKNCQRQIATPFSILVAVPEGALSMEGAQPDTYQDVGRQRAACVAKVLFKVRIANILGSHSYSDDGLDQGLNISDVSWLQPEVNVWCDSAQPSRFRSGSCQLRLR